MRKPSFLFIALALSTALWAQAIDNVAYIEANGTKVTVTNGDKTLKLVNPEKVEYIINKSGD